MKDISQEQVRFLFTYKDGMLIRNHTRSSKAIKGDVAGSLRPDGYRAVSITENKVTTRYLVHRLIFLYHYGYMPMLLDHKDLDRSNDRIGNLRECTYAENNRNGKSYKNATSAYKGVSKHYCGKWVASATFNKESFYLGLHVDEEDAARAFDIFVIEHHGKFARLNFPASPQEHQRDRL
jgi:hypothetical protein